MKLKIQFPREKSLFAIISSITSNCMIQTHDLWGMTVKLNEECCSRMRERRHQES